MIAMHRRRSRPLLRIAALVALLAGGAVVVPAAATDRVVVVHPGDTLSQIALEQGISLKQLVDWNAIADPNRIYPGQRLRVSAQPAPSPSPIAAPPTPRVHVVRSGEHLTGIARRYGTTIAAMVAANGIANPSFLRVGQPLTIPGPTASTGRTGFAMPASMIAAVAARDDIRAMIADEAALRGVPVAFALAVAWQESGWQPGVVSSAGAVGVMQLTPATADWVAATMLGASIDLHDAVSNVRAGVCLLRHYLDRYHGDRALVLAAYFQGQTAADRHGVYPITRSYIASILAFEAVFAG